MVKSKTRISKQAEKKTNSELVETVKLAKKNEKWLEVASILTRPRRKRVSLNLSDIDKEIKAGESVVIPGKVLSQGEISKKAKVIALNFSEKSKEKLLKAGCEVISIMDEIQKNKEMKGVKLLK